MFKYTPLDEMVYRQLVNSATLHAELTETAKLAKQFAGSMAWKQVGAYMCLVRSLPGAAQERLGRRSDATELTYKQFTEGKYEIELRFQLLKKKVSEAERQNKSLRVGRTPVAVVSLFQALETVGLQNCVTLIGTEAMYAFETSAAVRIRSIALAASSIELTKQENKRLQLLISEQCPIHVIVDILKELDSSFAGGADSCVYINSFGFEVELVLMSTTRPDAELLAAAPTVEQLVVDRSGRMATIQTLSASAFVHYKRWLATNCSDTLSNFTHLEEAEVVERMIATELVTGSHSLKGSSIHEVSRCPESSLSQ
jgi:hypothetical protein